MSSVSSPMFHKIRNIHMIGIGGSGMSGIAEVLHALGFTVTGSDLRGSETIEHLRSLGMVIHVGHAAENVAEAHVVVYSSAVRPDNVEVITATERKIPVIERAEMLGELTRMKFTIGVAGTHGKTTTTSMLGQILTTAGDRPTIIVGGIAKSLGSGGILGEGRHFVVEADEYRRTFLRMFPTIAIVTSLEADHLDCYDDLDDIRQTFAAYLERLPFFGVAIMCIDDPNVRTLVPKVQRSVVTYGLSEDADVRASDLDMSDFRCRYTVTAYGETLGRIEVPVPGEHNVRNSLAAVVAARELGVPFDRIQQGLSAFSGVVRRFQVLGTINDVMIVDDYAHHPTALRETLRTARNGWNTGRIVVLFQPHLYSRTRDFQKEFAEALMECDVAVLSDIYPSREQPMPGITSDLIVNQARDLGHPRVLRVGDLRDAKETLERELKPGDLLLTVGAGDVHTVGKALLNGEITR